MTATTDHWVRFDPAGCAHSSAHVAAVPLAEDAYRRAVPRIADRRREAAAGWTLERLTKEQWRERAKPCLTGACAHRAVEPPREVRGLTVRQPYAWALLHGKPVENRTWPVPDALVGSTVLLHAGKAPHRDGLRDPRVLALAGLPTLDDLVTGAVLAVGRLTGSHLETGGCCAPWGDREVFHWTFADWRPLKDPVTATGTLGLWRPAPNLLRLAEEAARVRA
ncbi:hypothetical protein ACFC0S_16040 [Streptomyces sp. NPDC056084]|uniref:hypothetical protein n=1 Tax=unclassified Streptomyces TaxID=2593676 RepID=UPI0035D9C10F